MRIKINMTDEDGTLLDVLTLNVPDGQASPDQVVREFLTQKFEETEFCNWCQSHHPNERRC